MKSFIEDTPIEISQSVLDTQAKEVITTPFDLIKEILLNSSDNLFGNKFYEFMLGQGNGSLREPCIPSLVEYDVWRKRLSENGKFGNITITFYRDYLQILDDGTGIPYEIKGSKIENYGEADSVSLKNCLTLHRRGQFSRGLKESFVALNNHLSKSNGKDGIVHIETIYKDKELRFINWEGEYYYHKTEKKFGVVHRSECPASVNRTFTKITVIYPKDTTLFNSRINKLVQDITSNLWIQRLLTEHNITIQKGNKRQVLSPYLKGYKVDILKHIKKRVEIPAGEEYEKYQKLLDCNFIEIDVQVKKMKHSIELDKVTSRSLQNPKITTRGIILSDYTTIYGILPIDNVIGTEYLQCEVLCPALRILSVVGNSGEKAFDALIFSNRKSINTNHPILSLVLERVMEIWQETVESEAQKVAKLKNHTLDKQDRIYKAGLESFMNNVFSQELSKRGNSKSNNGKLNNSKNLTQADSREIPFFGFQLSKNEGKISLYPKKEKELRIYVHKDLVDSKTRFIEIDTRGYNLFPQINAIGNLIRIPLSLAEAKKDLNCYLIRLIVKAPPEEKPPFNYKLDIMVPTNETSKLAHFIKNGKLDREELEKLYKDYIFPSTFTFGKNRIIVSNFFHYRDTPQKKTIGSDFITFNWETNYKYQVTPSRAEKQADATRGWIIRQKSSDTNSRITYEVSILCLSNFFSQTFNPNERLDDQPPEFQMLMASSLCCILSEILTPNTEDESELHLNQYTRHLNRYMPGLIQYIMKQEYLSN